MRKLVISLGAYLCMFSCAEDPKPKPEAKLRLDYPQAVYQPVDIEVPFRFEKNEFSKSIENMKTDSNTNSIGITIEYPKLKGTIYLTYKAINNDLIPLLRDAQNLTQKHTIKADEISEQPFLNDAKKVYGMFYEVGGNAASQSQFYVTDSINHFVNGALYFYTKPNYDSIYPAAEYLKNDIKHIMESLEWK